MTSGNVMKLWAPLALLLGLTAVPASAATIVLDPSAPTPGLIGLVCDGGDEEECIADEFGLTDEEAALLMLLYKDNVGTGEEVGVLFNTSYETEYFNEPDDPEDATISYVGGAFINCPECYLAIKGGQAFVPNLYVYDLAGWNGTDSIVMQNFWPQQGAISHVSIWGFRADQGCIDCPLPNPVPEPATLSLLGLGLLFVAARARQRLRARTQV